MQEACAGSEGAKAGFGMKKFLLYLLRWQLSGLVLAPCIYLLDGRPVVSAIVANGIGACVFFVVDRAIFKGREVK
jgi:hypothetical protein